MGAAPLATAFSWSGGKDSALALGRLLRDPTRRVERLLTTVGPDQRSSVHGLPIHLLQAQAEAIGLPLQPIVLHDPGLADYTGVMTRTARRLRAEGIAGIAFGDLDHAGTAAHRQALFAPLGLAVLQPLAGLTPPQFVAEFLASGVTATTVVVDAEVLGPHHLGRVFDQGFLDSLPEACDPCGEFGEFHTFVQDAPWFSHPVALPPAEPITVEIQVGTDEGTCTFRYWQLQLG